MIPEIQKQAYPDKKQNRQNTELGSSNPKQKPAKNKTFKN
jgi:hypothetical protein